MDGANIIYYLLERGYTLWLCSVITKTILLSLNIYIGPPTALDMYMLDTNHQLLNGDNIS